MNKLSTGQDSTLENWIQLCIIAFGLESKATQFLIKKAEKSPNGKAEEVIADESQLLFVLTQMHLEGIK